MARRSNPEPNQTEVGARRICMITGGTGGIGLSAAMAIGASGYDLLLVGRNTAQGAAAVQSVNAIAHGPAATFLQADLSSQAEVKRLAAAVRSGWPRIDALVHSAGTVQQRRRESADGVELTWAVNHLAPFLLTYMLLGTLQVSSPSRVIVVSSRSHRWGRMHWADPELHRGYNLLRAYSQSKLANLLFVQELNQRLSGLGVYATVVHPGLVRTGIARDVSGLAAFV
ncbi:MAG: SDR family NAD(P)-dependent oxidoreductase, partial [Anaerolineae bacterium]